MADEPWRPRWWLFWNLGGIVVVHLMANGGWTTATTVMVPIALALTLVLVFVRRLPSWLTGDGPARHPFLRVAGVAGLVLADALVVVVLVVHPPHGADVVNAGVLAALFLGMTVYALSRLLPRRLVTRRAALRRRLAVATAAGWLVAIVAVAGEVAAIVAGGWAPWILPLPAVVAVVALALWRSDLAIPARCLASGTWTPVTAAAFDVRPGEPVDGWAVLADDWRIRFHLATVPADIAAELADRRRLWLAGWPSDFLVTGLPDGDTYAVGLIGCHRRGGKNTVPTPPGHR